MLTKFIALLVVIAVSIGVGAYLGIRNTNDKPQPIIVTGLDEAIVMSTNGGLLEVSTVAATEVFTKETEHALPIFNIHLGTTYSAIRAKATYRYHVALAPEWKFVRNDKTFIVIAPPVRPSLPVAIDLATLQAQANGTWSLLTGNTQIAALQKTITAALDRKANLPQYVALQRETARKTVAEFVQKWVLSQDKWKGGGYTVRVFFADESIGKIRENGLFPVPLK